jgi:hypothetical protein
LADSDVLNRRTSASGATPWLRLAAGAAALLALFCFLSRGYAPPGAAGDVIRHNLRNGIDATPIFYTEIEDSFAFDYAELFIE